MTDALLTEAQRLEYLLRGLSLQESDFRVDGTVDVPAHRDHKNCPRRAPCLERMVDGHHTLPGGSVELHAFLKQAGKLYARTLNSSSRLQISVGPRYAA